MIHSCRLDFQVVRRGWLPPMRSQPSHCTNTSPLVHAMQAGASSGQAPPKHNTAGGLPPGLAAWDSYSIKPSAVSHSVSLFGAVTFWVQGMRCPYFWRPTSDLRQYATDDRSGKGPRRGKIGGGWACGRRSFPRQCRRRAVDGGATTSPRRHARRSCCWWFGSLGELS